MSPRATVPVVLLLATACGGDREPAAQPSIAGASEPRAAAGPASGSAALAQVRAFLDEQAPLADPDACGIDRRVPDLSFDDAEGRTRRLSEWLDGRALVVAVRHPDEPLEARYGLRLAELAAAFGPRGVRFLWLGSGAALDPAFARGLTAEFSVYAPDPDGALARSLGVEAATACFVLDASRTLRYRGAVDDQHGRGVVLDAPRRHFLRDALESVLADERVARPATIAPGRALDFPRGDDAPDAAPLTFHDRIARVLQRHCVSCHHDGGAGPFPLDAFEPTYDRRRMISMVVSEGFMPPWYAAPDSVPFHNDARMPPEDVAAVVDWVAAGAPEGDPADAPVRLAWGGDERWEIGAPDEVFQLFEAKRLPPEGTIEWDPIPADRRAPRDLWVQRVEVRPTDPSVVHHCNVYFRPPPEYAERAPGSRPGWQRLVGYLPGKDPVQFPPGLASFVPAGSELMFDMHYTPQGRATVDRTRMGVVLADGPPRFMPSALILRQPVIEIAPNETAEFSAELTVPRDTAILSVGPHMHLRGDAVEVDLIRPDGERTRLLSSVWDPDWQFTYLLSNELVIPGGSRLVARGRFDNTAANADNPDPSAWVYEGPQSWDEMLLVAVGSIRPREDPVVFQGGWPEIPTMTDGAKARDARKQASEANATSR